MDLSIKDGHWWGTDLCLAAWVGYQSRQGAYGAQDGPGPSDGAVELIFAPEGRGLEPLSEQERHLLTWFEQNEPVVSAAVKAAIIAWCSPECSERETRFDFGDDFPVIRSDEDLKQSIGLYAVNIHQIEAGGVPYVGYEFGCVWDDEHGLGILMHGTRVVDIGFADTALTLWVAERDATKIGT